MEDVSVRAWENSYVVIFVENQISYLSQSIINQLQEVPLIVL
jgi:hypothetical protein